MEHSKSVGEIKKIIIVARVASSHEKQRQGNKLAFNGNCIHHQKHLALLLLLPFV